MPQYKVNITIVSEGGMRVNSIPAEREVMSSGSYRPGFCYAEDVLPAGTYTMVISTYKPDKVRKTKKNVVSLTGVMKGFGLPPLATEMALGIHRLLVRLAEASLSEIDPPPTGYKHGQNPFLVIVAVFEGDNGLQCVYFLGRQKGYYRLVPTRGCRCFSGVRAGRL